MQVPNLEILIGGAVKIAKESHPTTKIITEGFHISLSRTVYLKEFQIESISKILKAKISEHAKFKLKSTQFAKYQNDEKTRSFLGIKVADTQGQVIEPDLACCPGRHN